MTALAADVARVYETDQDDKIEYIKLAGTVFAGSALVWSTTAGQAKVHGTEIADFCGFALKGGVAGDVIPVRVKGILRLSINATIVAADVGAAVSVKNGDDNDFDLTGGAGTVIIGAVKFVYVAGGLGTNDCGVHFRGAGFRVAP
jgi:hypothetical protein